MQRLSIWILGILFSISLWSCSKKIHPTENKISTVTVGSTETTKTTVNTMDSSILEVKKAPIVKSEPKKLFPKVISVNDAVAQKSIDGRLFYDVMNHRYWKNYKDGKYYLFSKSMYKNPDFKPPSGN